MELAVIGSIPANAERTISQGSQVVSVSAGQSLKIETSPDGIEIIDVQCPEGKLWSVTVSVTVSETSV